MDYLTRATSIVNRRNSSTTDINLWLASDGATGWKSNVELSLILFISNVRLASLGALFVIVENHQISKISLSYSFFFPPFPFLFSLFPFPSFFFSLLFVMRSRENQKLFFIFKILISKGAFSPANGHFIFRPRLRRGRTQHNSTLLVITQH